MAEKNHLKYMRIYNWGRTLIVSGVLRKGERFPSEPALQKKFGYSRQTVRLAMTLLKAEGLVESLRGSGTYVSFEREKQGMEVARIGVLLSYYADYLFPEVYAGIESVMLERGIKLEVAISRNRLNEEALYLESFLKMNVKGLIIEGTKSSFPNPHIRLYEEIRKRNIPTLFIHNHYSNIPFDSIEMQDAQLGYELTKMLVKKGHRKIAAIFKYDDLQGMERYRGFLECLSHHRIPMDDDCILWYSTKDMDEKFSKKSLQEFYRKTRHCSAIILYNDEIANRYISFLQERAVRIPEDLSIVSFDDAALSYEGNLQLSSAIHPKFALGELAARSLLRMIGDTDWQSKNYSYRFSTSINWGNTIAKKL